MPASRQSPTILVASWVSVAPHARKNSLPPPKVPVPKLRADTLSPEEPSCLYSILSLMQMCPSLVLRDAVVALFCACVLAEPADLKYMNNNRPLLDAHNCYPYDGRW